ncbi:hypothetical protein WA026_013216 [Henosepilachna vigintioctopunctata]|uniref:Uncharacterized protein n=1 Tax=Henosepilachna vigintioctopunctata TaxID=420089 RepID=A0AAW1UN79_9CUCU
MTSMKVIFAFLAVVLALATAAPSWGHKSHEHVVIHVPYKVHTVHHHHVKKIHIPVVKKVIIEEPHHYEHIEHHGGWW